MAIGKNQRMSAILVLFSLLLYSRSYRQEDELDQLLIDVDDSKSDVSAEKLKVVAKHTVATDKVYKLDSSQTAVDRAQAEQAARAQAETIDKVNQFLRAQFKSNTTAPGLFGIDLPGCRIDSANGVSCQAQFVLGAYCPLGSATVGVKSDNGGLEVSCIAQLEVNCAFGPAQNLKDLKETCACVGVAPCGGPAGHLKTAIDTAIPRVPPEVAQILTALSNGAGIPWKVSAKVGVNTGVGGKAVAALGTHEDAEGFTMVGGGASAGCGLKVEAIVLIGGRPEDHPKGKGWKIAIGIPHAAVTLKIERPTDDIDGCACCGADEDPPTDPAVRAD